MSMKWPWVSRRDYEWLQNWMLGERKFFEDQAMAQQDRYNALVEKYHALALPVLPVMATPVVREPVKPSVIAQAIRDESVGDPRLAAFLRNRSREIKLEHPSWTDEQIATELARWETTADQDAPTP